MAIHYEIYDVFFSRLNFENKMIMKNKKLSTSKISVILMVLVAFLLNGCFDTNSRIAGNEKETGKNAVTELEGSITTTEIAVESPPFTDGIFPCNDCHSEIEPNSERRELIDFHDDINAIFNHDSNNRWCLDCHDLNNRDSLRLASGKLLDFKESYKLCGQCHGEKLRDWKVGVHGKRIGEWNGRKEYLLCVHCHNPHSPKFEEVTPEPPPVLQEDIN